MLVWRWGAKPPSQTHPSTSWPMFYPISHPCLPWAFCRSFKHYWLKSKFCDVSRCKWCGIGLSDSVCEISSYVLHMEAESKPFLPEPSSKMDWSSHVATQVPRLNRFLSPLANPAPLAPTVFYFANPVPDSCMISICQIPVADWWFYAITASSWF